MSDLASLVARPGPRPRTVQTEDGAVRSVPAGWELLPPGDAGLTRRVKAAGPSWTVREQRGRRAFSRGVWAPEDTIDRCRTELEAQRASPAHQRKQAADRARRERQQQAYAEDFEAAVREFLSFHEPHSELQRELARQVAAHATPVGSGTVARTQRIPIERRAEAAVVAWLRHQTTAYDRMQIARVKGRRREVRRALARRSRELLDGYRRGHEAPADCPLARALSRAEAPAEEPLPEGDHQSRQDALKQRVLARLRSR